MKIQDGIFAALYRRSYREGKSDDTPWNICTILTVSTNLTILAFYNFIANQIVGDKSHLMSDTMALILFILTFGAIYFIFIRKSRFQELALAYDKLSQSKQRFYRIISNLYVYFSLVAMFVSIFWS